MERKRSFEKVPLLKNHIVKKQLFRESSRPEKVVLLKKWMLCAIAFLKNYFSKKQLFGKSASFEDVLLLKVLFCSKKNDAVQKYLFRNSSSSVDIFVLNKFLFQKSSFSEKLPVPKKQLLGRRLTPNKQLY